MSQGRSIPVTPSNQYIVVVISRFHDETEVQSLHGPFDTDEQAEAWARAAAIGEGQPHWEQDDWEVLPILSPSEPIPTKDRTYIADTVAALKHRHWQHRPGGRWRRDPAGR